MTIGQFECYVAASGEPAQARELPPPATPDMGRAAGERFRIEILGPPPPRRGRRTNHNGPGFTCRSPATISPPTEATWPS
jgi:hypothetical protein